MKNEEYEITARTGLVLYQKSDFVRIRTRFVVKISKISNICQLSKIFK